MKSESSFSLFAVAALFSLPLLLGQSTKADPTYTASVLLPSPGNDSTYTTEYHNGQTYVDIPLQTTSHYVSITGATPLVYLTVSYGMALYNVYAYNGMRYYIGEDAQSGVQVLPDASGHWMHSANGTNGWTGSYRMFGGTAYNQPNYADGFSAIGATGTISSLIEIKDNYTVLDYF